MKLVINLENPNDITAAIAFLSGQKAVSNHVHQLEETTLAEVDPMADLGGVGGESGSDMDDLLGGSGSDDLDSLIGGGVEETPKVPTLEDIKAAIGKAIAAKGKDKATEFLQTVLTKLKVVKLSAIPEEKRGMVIEVVEKWTAKK